MASDTELLERSAYLAENPDEVVPWEYTSEEEDVLAASADAAAEETGQDRDGDENVTHSAVHDRALAAGMLEPLAAPASEAARLAQYTLAMINGRPYAADGSRFGTYPHGQAGEHFDCSGSQSRGLNDLGHTGVPTISATQARWCRDNGLDGLSVARASSTAGAPLFAGANHGYDGWGPDGHVIGSLGNGWSYEARGRSYGCGSWPIAGRGWSNAGLWPGVNYLGGVDPSPPGPPVFDFFERDIQEDDMSDTLVPWTADNLPGEWHFAQVARSGDAYHSWGPGDRGFEFLCGPTVPDTSRRTAHPVVKVTRKLGAGDLRRVDLMFELDGSDDVAHMWRGTNAEKWGFEVLRPGSQ